MYSSPMQFAAAAHSSVCKWCRQMKLLKCTCASPIHSCVTEDAWSTLVQSNGAGQSMHKQGRRILQSCMIVILTRCRSQKHAEDQSTTNKSLKQQTGYPNSLNLNWKVWISRHARSQTRESHSQKNFVHLATVE